MAGSPKPIKEPAACLALLSLSPVSLTLLIKTERLRNRLHVNHRQREVGQPWPPPYQAVKSVQGAGTRIYHCISLNYTSSSFQYLRQDKKGQECVCVLLVSV